MRSQLGGGDGFLAKLPQVPIVVARGGHNATAGAMMPGRACTGERAPRHEMEEEIALMNTARSDASTAAVAATTTTTISDCEDAG